MIEVSILFAASNGVDPSMTPLVDSTEECGYWDETSKTIGFTDCNSVNLPAICEKKVASAYRFSFVNLQFVFVSILNLVQISLLYFSNFL